MPGCTAVFLFGRLETCLENSLLKQLCTVVAFYVHMYVTHKTFVFWEKKNAAKIESVRIKVVSEVFNSVLLHMCMTMLSLVAYSGFIFSAGPLPQSGMTWIFSGVELGLSNETHCVMQGWSLKPKNQTFHRWPIIVCSLFSRYLPWALGVWFAEVLSPHSCSLTQWKLLWTYEMLFIAKDYEEGNEGPSCIKLSSGNFWFSVLKLSHTCRLTQFDKLPHFG